jgi:hypothetical protein
MGQPHGKPANAGTAPGARTAAAGGGASQRPLRTAPGTNAALVTPQPARPRANAAPDEAARAPSHVEDNRVPVVIRYRVGPTKSQPKPPVVNTVEVAIEAENWKCYPLAPSSDDFFTVVNLSKGTHGYKFFVNGVETVDARQPNRPAAGSVPAANIVAVSDAMLQTREDAEAADDDTEGWGQKIEAFEETRKLPPILPPHLRYTPLNTPPTQYRCDTDGTVSAVANDFALDPEHLPMPLSATINHVYFQRRDDHIVVGVTTRFRNKFTSVVLYKGDSHGAIPTVASTAPQDEGM